MGQEEKWLDEYNSVNGLVCYSSQQLRAELSREAIQFSSVSVMSDFLQPDELQRTRPPCPSPTPGVQPNPCPLSQ